MSNQELLQELKEKFEEEKKRLGFKAEFEKVNDIYCMSDMVLSDGFVSEKFSRQLINRIVELFASWLNEIYSWVYPNQMDFIHLNENRTLSEEERKEILLMIDRVMYLVRKNKLIAFEYSGKKEEGDFVDELVEFNEKYFTPFVLKFYGKFEKFWRDEFNKNS